VSRPFACRCPPRQFSRHFGFQGILARSIISFPDIVRIDTQLRQLGDRHRGPRLHEPVARHPVAANMAIWTRHAAFGNQRFLHDRSPWFPFPG
jgi:hypothetical protein